MQTYQEFLEAKIAVAPQTGLAVEIADIHPVLKPHQRDMVRWAVHGGRRALFASFGLGKSLMQMEICRLIHERLGGKALIVCPLGVRQEFLRDSALLSMTWQFVRTSAEVSEGQDFYLTNYESVREGKLNPTGFSVVSLDEAAILRGLGGVKTFRTMMAYFEGTSTYRYVATATPSPNEYLELAAYAEFLGIMETGEIKTRWFKRDSQKADHLTLHPHKAQEFWAWLSTWSAWVQQPSDVCGCVCHGAQP